MHRREIAQECGDVLSVVWWAAHDANRAFDQQTLAQRQLAAADLLLSHPVEGVVITDEGRSNLQELAIRAGQDHERYGNRAAPFMIMPDSPFAVELLNGGELVVDRDSPFFNLADLHAFAIKRGYIPAIASKVFNVLVRAGRKVQVSGLADYTAVTDCANPSFVELRTIVCGDGDSAESFFEKSVIASLVPTWYAKKPNFQHLGIRGISFLADYCNHACPDLQEELLVKQRPLSATESARKLQDKIAGYRRMEPQELLLEEVWVRGKPHRAVTARSLSRHALIAVGREPQYGNLFSSIFSVERMNDLKEGGPEGVKGGFVSGALEDGRSVQGILPGTFKELIAVYETSPDRRQRLMFYSDFCRDAIRAYLAELQKHNLA